MNITREKELYDENTTNVSITLNCHSKRSDRYCHSMIIRNHKPEDNILHKAQDYFFNTVLH